MPGHPAKYNTAAYETQNVRGAHVTLEMGIQRPCDSGGIIIVIIIISVPPCSCVRAAEQQRPLPTKEEESNGARCRR